MFRKISLSVLLLALIISTQGRVYTISSSSDSSESSESSKSSESSESSKSSDSSELSDSKELYRLYGGRTIVVYLPASQQETVLNSVVETADKPVTRSQHPALDAANSSTLNNNMAVIWIVSKEFPGRTVR
uniref:Uncharacterized protein n=1 Tax=Timema cristinae TaxID=61476 RepID=A0A7R9HEI3_TIMCR|nr:unnamed protein product [Timema cristinae]